MQVTFIRWCVDPKGRNPVSVNPERVDCIEHFGSAYKSPYPDVQEDMPAATKIIMRNKQEYIVQGTVDWVVQQLNATQSSSSS